MEGISTLARPIALSARHGQGAGRPWARLRSGIPWTRGGAELHPLLLDGCFQVLSVVRHLSGAEQGETYMPFGWKRLWVAGPMPERFVCHAVLRNPPGGEANAEPSAPPEVATGDVRFYSLDGTLLGALLGFTVKRATRAALLSSYEGVKDLLYEVVWREKPLGRSMASAGFLNGPATVAAGSRLLTDYLAEEGVDAREMTALLQDLERLSQAYALSALERLGWERQAGEAVSPEELRSRLGVLDDHRRVFARFMDLLADAGILAPFDKLRTGHEDLRTGHDKIGAEHEGFAVKVGAGEPLPDPSLGDAESLARQLMDKYPHGVNEIGLLRRCGSALAEVLQGRADALSLMFSDDDTGAADHYLKSPASLAANRMLGDAVTAAVSRLPEGRRLRVLEVGAGTGASTDAVIASLPAGRFDYVYTDISAGFFAQAEERLASFDTFRMGAAIEYRTLDIEADPVAQGFNAHGYDLVNCGQRASRYRRPGRYPRQLPRVACAVGPIDCIGEDAEALVAELDLRAAGRMVALR